MGTSVRQLLLMTDKKMETTISKEKKTSAESTSMKEENLPEGLLDISATVIFELVKLERAYAR